jgi:hypothetical protein
MIESGQRLVYEHLLMIKLDPNDMTPMINKFASLILVLIDSNFLLFCYFLFLHFLQRLDFRVYYRA